MMNFVSIGRGAHNLTVMYTSILYIVGVSPVSCYAKATVLLPSHGRGENSSQPWEEATTAVVTQQYRSFKVTRNGRYTNYIKD